MKIKTIKTTFKTEKILRLKIKSLERKVLAI